MTFPTAKYWDSGWAKTRALTLEAGIMDSDSLSSMPVGGGREKGKRSAEKGREGRVDGGVVRGVGDGGRACLRRRVEGRVGPVSKAGVPDRCVASRRFHMVVFSVWSGCDG